MTGRATSAAVRFATSPCVIALGEFDGFHLGHASLVDVARGEADARPQRLVGVVLDRGAPRSLMTIRERCAALVAAGAQNATAVDVSEVGAGVIESVVLGLVQNLRPTTAVLACLPDHQVEPRWPELRPMLRDARVRVIEAPRSRTQRGVAITSDLVSETIAAGDVATAASLLGHRFGMSGIVIPGDRRGRTIGFPTANLSTEGRITPAAGVYAAWVRVPGGQWWPAAVNVGFRPTFYERDGVLLVEAHLLDCDDDLYGAEIRVEFVERLRAERRFADVAALVAQLQRDVATARQMLTSATG